MCLAPPLRSPRVVGQTSEQESGDVRHDLLNKCSMTLLLGIGDRGGSRPPPEVLQPSSMPMGTPGVEASTIGKPTAGSQQGMRVRCVATLDYATGTPMTDYMAIFCQVPRSTKVDHHSFGEKLSWYEMGYIYGLCSTPLDAVEAALSSWIQESKATNIQKNKTSHASHDGG